MKTAQTTAHLHNYARREIGLGGTTDHVCTTCGFRIPENCIDAAIAGGATASPYQILTVGDVDEVRVVAFRVCSVAKGNGWKAIDLLDAARSRTGRWRYFPAAPFIRKLRALPAFLWLNEDAPEAQCEALR